MVSEVDENTVVTGNRTTANHAGNRLTDGGGGEAPVRNRKDATPPSPRRHHKHSSKLNHFFVYQFNVHFVAIAAALDSSGRP